MTELAVRESAPLAAWTPSFAVSLEEAVAKVEAKHEFFRRVMREDQHYGKIPGTGANAKPTLLKPGAELLLSNMGLQKELADADAPTIDYGEDGREGLIRYRRVCRIYRQTGSTELERMLVAQAEGSCSSRETKYRWRESKRKCPACQAEAIIKGKAEYGGGWLCFKKQNGCGAKFKDGDAAIEAQVTGRMPNPDIADVENTILKMADKRALVAATLLATGCSDIFTQDMEDAPGASQRPSDVIDAEYVEDAPAEPNGDTSNNISSADVLQIRALFKALDFPLDRQAKAVGTASEGRTTELANLLKPEAMTLGRQLTALKKKTTTACDVCKGAIDKDGYGHAFDAQGVPCPSDATDEAETARVQRYASDKLAAKLGAVEEPELAF